MNVVLIGYRGTGKSTVGKVVAARLERVLVSTDAEIVKLVGQSIPEIVEQHGWEYFRDLEAKVCQESGRPGWTGDRYWRWSNPSITKCRGVERNRQAILADRLS